MLSFVAVTLFCLSHVVVDADEFVVTPHYHYSTESSTYGSHIAYSLIQFVRSSIPGGARSQVEIKTIRVKCKSGDTGEIQLCLFGTIDFDADPIHCEVFSPSCTGEFTTHLVGSVPVDLPDPTWIGISKSHSPSLYYYCTTGDRAHNRFQYQDPAEDLTDGIQTPTWDEGCCSWAAYWTFCEENWAVGTMNPSVCVPKCGGIAQDMDWVCNGNGTCTEADTCVCDARHLGPDCEFDVTCNGVVYTDSSVCSSGGDCFQVAGVGECTCDRHHRGQWCEEHARCNGIYWYEAIACTSLTRGDCVIGDADVCQCYDGFTGDNCQYYTCNGISELEPSVCSGSGSCIGPGICECDFGYKGVFCSAKKQCGGFDFDLKTLACYGRGDCVDEDECECESGFTGENCELTECFDIQSDLLEVCSGVGYCMCETGKHYGRECQEVSHRHNFFVWTHNLLLIYAPQYLPQYSVVLSGETTDDTFEFLVPYYVDVAFLPFAESDPDVGVQVGCSQRFIHPDFRDVVGNGAICSWVLDSFDARQTEAVKIVVDWTSPILWTDGSNHLLEGGKRKKVFREVDIGFSLLTTDIPEFAAEVTVRVRIDDPFVGETVSRGGLPGWGIGSIVGAVIFVIFLALLVSIAGLAFFLYARKTHLDTEAAMMRKVQELASLQADFQMDKKKLELALRLQRVKNKAPKNLSDEFVHLEALDDEHMYVGLGPDSAMPTDDVWRRCFRERGVLMGHEVILRKLDTNVKSVTRRTVNRLIEKSVAWALAPPHEHVRKYHAYWVEGVEIGTVKKSAAGPRLLVSFAEEFETTEGETADAPNHGFLIAPIEDEVGVIDYLWEKKREATEALEGITVRSGVRLGEKVKWCCGIAQAIAHLHRHGCVVQDLTVHGALLSAKTQKAILDMPFLARPPRRNAFLAPEIVLDVIGRSVDGDRNLGSDGVVGHALSEGELSQRADVYSFGMILYCILHETKRPFRTVRSQLQDAERLGERAAVDPSFRPSLKDSFLPDWAGNLLRQCWAASPSLRPSMFDLVSSLESVSSALEATQDFDDLFVLVDDSSEDCSQSEDSQNVGECL